MIIIKHTHFLCLFFFIGLFQVTTGQPYHSAGNALSFDGVDDYVDIGNSGLSGTDPFSITAWVKGDMVKFSKIYYQGDRTSSNALMFYIGDSGSNGILKIDFYANAVAGDIRVDDGQWHHVAVTFDGNIARLYVDGVLDAEGDPGSVNYRDNDNSIGIDLNQTNDAFRGTIDEMTLWNRQLTISEIQEQMTQCLSGSEPGLIGYWRFNKGNGSIVQDYSTNNNDGTLQ